MKTLRFKGLPGTALKNQYDNGKFRFGAIGDEQELPDDVADTLLADFPGAFEVVEAKRDTKPERNRMRTSAPHKRGKG